MKDFRKRTPFEKVARVRVNCLELSGKTHGYAKCFENRLFDRVDLRASTLDKLFSRGIIKGSLDEKPYCPRFNKYHYGFTPFSRSVLLPFTWDETCSGATVKFWSDYVDGMSVSDTTKQTNGLSVEYVYGYKPLYSIFTSRGPDYDPMGIPEDLKFPDLEVVESSGDPKGYFSSALQYLMKPIAQWFNRYFRYK